MKIRSAVSVGLTQQVEGYGVDLGDGDDGDAWGDFEGEGDGGDYSGSGGGHEGEGGGAVGRIRGNLKSPQGPVILDAHILGEMGQLQRAAESATNIGNAVRRVVSGLSERQRGLQSMSVAVGGDPGWGGDLLTGIDATMGRGSSVPRGHSIE